MLELNDFRITISGIEGRACFCVGNIAFPSENWLELVSSDLEAWATSIVSFGLRHTDRCDFCFCDGPYAFRLEWKKDTVWASGFHNGKEVLPSREVDIQSLLRSFVKAVRRYNRFRHEGGLEPVFIKELSILHDILT